MRRYKLKEEVKQYFDEDYHELELHVSLWIDEHGVKLNALDEVVDPFDFYIQKVETRIDIHVHSFVTFGINKRYDDKSMTPLIVAALSGQCILNYEVFEFVNKYIRTDLSAKFVENSFDEFIKSKK